MCRYINLLLPHSADVRAFVSFSGFPLRGPRDAHLVSSDTGEPIGTCAGGVRASIPRAAVMV